MHEAPFDSQLFLGEVVRVFGDTGEGWSWVQNETDGYVGFVRADTLGALAPEPTHRVTALRTFVYPGPDMKLPPAMSLTLGSRIALGETVETRGTPLPAGRRRRQGRRRLPCRAARCAAGAGLRRRR